TTVALTPDQRERVVAATGVGVQSVVLPGSPAAWERTLPRMRKHEIERLALKQGAEDALRIEKKKALEKVLKALRDITDPVKEIQDAIAVLEKEGPEGLEKLAREQQKEREQQ